MIPRHLAIGLAVMLAVALGMSFYLWRMRAGARAVESEASATISAPVAAPVAGPTEQAILYVADDESGEIHPVGTRIPLPGARQARAEELLRALVTSYLEKNSTHPLGPGSEVLNVYLVDPGIAVIDVNQAFADGHRSGIMVEELTVASLIETLGANIQGIRQVKILVDGKERDTLAGHADLTQFYDVSAINQVVAGLSAAR